MNKYVAATVKYTSSNTKVATVNSKTGVVKGIKAGTVTITAKAGALKTTCKVVVKNPAFSLVKSSATIKKGKTTTIRSKATPVSTVTYTSSNKKVATVTGKGVVKGISKGKATITVKCNGITKKFVVTVKYCNCLAKSKNNLCRRPFYVCGRGLLIFCGGSENDRKRRKEHIPDRSRTKRGEKKNYGKRFKRQKAS